jgi:hypothetical protein
MKVKMTASAIFMMLLTLGATAQFHFEVGGSLLYGTGKLPKNADVYAEKPTILGYGIFLYPRYNVSETESGAISVGIPATLGLSGSVNSQTGGSLNLTADLPVTVDYNVGAGSTASNESGFGGFVGVGFGYTYTNQSYEYITYGGSGYDQFKASSYGPLVHAGIKAVIGQKTYFLRAFYKMGLETEKFKTFGGAIGVAF